MILSIYFMLFVCCPHVESNLKHVTHIKYFDQFYAEGLKAYHDQLWNKCAYNLEKAINKYNVFKESLTNFRLMCKNESSLPYINELDDMHLSEFAFSKKNLKHADCFRKHKRDAYELRPGIRINNSLKNAFEKRVPYEYLHYCWYKLDRWNDAASASYTFYLANPNDENMRNNIAFYRDVLKVVASDFIDLEMRPYKEHYIRGMVALDDEQWQVVVDQLERAVSGFFVEVDRCCVDCEDELWLTDTTHFSGIVAGNLVEIASCTSTVNGIEKTVLDHFLQMLRCCLMCEKNVSIIFTEPVDDLLLDQYISLQKAYYKLDKIQEAMETVGTVLFLQADNNFGMDMKKNLIMNYLYSQDEFIPRKEVKVYVKRREGLVSLLNYLEEHFSGEDPDVVFIKQEDAMPDSGVQEVGRSSPETEDPHSVWMERYERLGLHMIAKESDLGRQYRFAADGLLKQEQCEDMLGLMGDISTDQNGVKIFVLGDAKKKLIAADEAYEASFRLFMRATDVVRHYTQRLYNMSGSLYFKNMSLVCWEPLSDNALWNRCLPQEFGTCVTSNSVKWNELVEDEFVTATHLRSLDDGDFLFLSESQSVEASVGVRSGRTIGWQAGDRHRFHVPRSGERCSLVICYTMHRTAAEDVYTDAIQTLHRLEEIRMLFAARSRHSVMRAFEDAGVRVVKNGADLGSGERFLADGLASSDQCSSLLRMIESGALAGDGYDHLDGKPSVVSPHTENELFQGLTVYRAAKLMHMGLIDTSSMRSFLELSESSRTLVEKYFNLTRPLYFDFTHLVCRSAVDDSNDYRSDLSHPVHADNCLLKADGTCTTDYPAFTQRDYSAILYLNDNFVGGDFFFAFANTTEQVSVTPKCGRLVGFNASQFHGVKPVHSGTRCALALWFTMNAHFKELAHVHAKKILRDVLADEKAQKTMSPRPKGSDEIDGVQYPDGHQLLLAGQPDQPRQSLVASDDRKYSLDDRGDGFKAFNENDVSAAVMANGVVATDHTTLVIADQGDDNDEL